MKNNLVGNRYGRLIVTREYGRAKDKHILWLCKCDCGSEIIVQGNSLTTGHTQSCGCLIAERNGMAKTEKKRKIAKPKTENAETKSRRLPMDMSEIRYLYDNAADQHSQIVILSELCLMTKKEMCKLLGEPEYMARPMSRKEKKRRIIDCFRNGMKPEQLAHRFGISEDFVLEYIQEA